MRKIYFIRHGRPDIPPDRHLCIGSTDLHLGSLGRMQAFLLGRELSGKISGVFCSPLLRASETAAFLSDEYKVIPGFEELSAGEWDGLSFDEIRKKWPEIYEKRGNDPSFAIPGSESPDAGLKRFSDTLDFLLPLTEGDIAIVTHTTILGAFLAFLKGENAEKCRNYKIPCGSYLTVCYENGKFDNVSEPVLPSPVWTDNLCLGLRRASGLPEHICAHCDATAAAAERILTALENAGYSPPDGHFDHELIRQASLLHDIARLEPHHEKTGGDYLQMLGANRLSEIVRRHGFLDREEIGNAAIVFIADKVTREAKTVSVEDRYESQRDKCQTAESLLFFEKRYAQAIRIRNMINNICGKEVI